jgi:hypothetical protein
MTKQGGFSLGARGDHVANLHLVMGDDDVIDQQFHQLSALGTRELVQGGLQPPAKGLEPLGQSGDIHLLLRLSLELAPWLCQAVLGPHHLLSCAFEFIAPDDLRQVDFQPPRLLPFELGEGIMQGLPPGLQGLGQPCPTVGTRQFMGDKRWLGQDPTQILPDQLVQGEGRGIARRAALSSSRPQRIGPTTVEIVVIARGKGASQTRQLTRATTHQAPEPVVMRGVVPAGHLGIPRQAGLSRGKGLRANDGRHGESDPLLRRGRPMTVPRPHGAQGGAADARRHRAGAFAVGGARVDRRTEDAPHRGDIPAWSPAWSRDLVVGQTLGHAIEAGRRLGVGIPRQDLGDHRGLDRLEPQALGITWALGIHDIPLGGDAPGQPLTTAPLRLAATSHPVGDQGALILGHGTPDLEQELIVRILTHGPVQELDLTASLGEFLDEEDLMDIVAGQPIGGREQDPCKGSQGDATPPPIQAWPIQLGPTIPIVAVDMCLSQMPIGLGRHMGAKTGQLLLNRLCVLLPGGRDTDIQGYFQGIPPARVMAQDMCLHGDPSPIAEGTGRRHPSVVHRCSVRSPCGVSARVCSGVPPASRKFDTPEDTRAMGLVP